MKDEQKIYIKGNSKRGAEVIKILTNLGGRNSHSMDGDNVNAYYFINPNGIIVNSHSYGDNVFSFVREFYKEIQLPRWNPKFDEAYWVVTTSGDVDFFIWREDSTDKKLFNFGNCFKTKEEAKIMAEKIKKLLKDKL